MRRNHTKSRFGCKECKTRRLKCDESRPSCTRCLQGKKQCSFLADAPALPSPVLSTPDSPGSTTNTTLSATNTTLSALGPLTSYASSAAHSSPSAVDPSLDERYGSLHLRLLYHFDHELTELMKPHHPGMDFLTRLFLDEAFHTPYLMEAGTSLLGRAQEHAPGWRDPSLLCCRGHQTPDPGLGAIQQRKARRYGRELQIHVHLCFAVESPHHI